VLEQRFSHPGVGDILRPDRPDILAGRGGYALELSATGERGGRNDAPARFVEVHRERLLVAGVVVRITDAPDVIVGDRRGGEEGRIAVLCDQRRPVGRSIGGPGSVKITATPWTDHASTYFNLIVFI
jgi:hypothetical protein